MIITCAVLIKIFWISAIHLENLLLSLFFVSVHKNTVEYFVKHLHFNVIRSVFLT